MFPTVMPVLCVRLSAMLAVTGEIVPSAIDGNKKIQATSANEKVKVAFWLNPTDDLDRNDPRTGRTDLTSQEVGDFFYLSGQLPEK